jgi:hypothetical protein
LDERDIDESSRETFFSQDSALSIPDNSISSSAILLMDLLEGCTVSSVPSDSSQILWKTELLEKEFGGHSMLKGSWSRAGLGGLLFVKGFCEGTSAETVSTTRLHEHPVLF